MKPLPQTTPQTGLFRGNPSETKHIMRVSNVLTSKLHKKNFSWLLNNPAENDKILSTTIV